MQLLYLVIFAAAIVGSITNVNSAATPAAEPAPQLPALDFVGELAAAPSLSAAEAYDGLGINDGIEFGAIEEADYFQLQPCNLNEPNKNECIRDLFQQIVPKLKDAGLPQYGMGSIDPYFYRRGIFRYSNDGIQGGLLLKNMEIYGLSNLQITNVISNFTDKSNGFIIKLSAEIPNIKAGGQFKSDVKFGGLRLVPKGPFNITLEKIRSTILTEGYFEQNELGQQRIKLNRLNANIAIAHSNIIANGIFSDRNLNTMILNLVNENLPEIIRVGIPATRDQWAPILIQHINDFFANVPIDKLLQK